MGLKHLKGWERERIPVLKGQYLKAFHDLRIDKLNNFI